MFDELERCAVIAEDEDAATAPLWRQLPSSTDFNRTLDALIFAPCFKALDVTTQVGKENVRRAGL